MRETERIKVNSVLTDGWGTTPQHMLHMWIVSQPSAQSPQGCRRICTGPSSAIVRALFLHIKTRERQRRRGGPKGGQGRVNETFWRLSAAQLEKEGWMSEGVTERDMKRRKERESGGLSGQPHGQFSLGIMRVFSAALNLQTARWESTAARAGPHNSHARTRSPTA